MDLIVTVGIPITCFIFGYFLGYRGVLELVGASVKAGYTVGQETLLKQLMASGQFSPSLLELSETQEDVSKEDVQDKMSFGFDLGHNKKDDKDVD